MQVWLAGLSLVWTLLLASPVVFEVSTRDAMLLAALALLPAIPLSQRRSRRRFRAGAGLTVLAYLALVPFIVLYAVFLLPPVVLLCLCAVDPARPRPTSLLKVFALVLGAIACLAVALVVPGLL